MNYKSKYWQNIKLSKPPLNNYLKSIAIGMILSDATIAKHGKYAYIKFEQGTKQKEFIENLWNNFKEYSFQENYSIRYQTNNKNEIKSYYFKTFTHPTFLDLYNIFYINGKKDLTKGFILNNIDDISLAYWIMGDGSLSKKFKLLTLHTQNFSKECNLNIIHELNMKFNLECTLGTHLKNDKVYHVINIPHRNIIKVYNIVNTHIIDSMKYKIIL